MSLDQSEVRRVARLAELDVAESEFGLLADQLARIVDYVGQLARLTTDSAPVDPDQGPAAPLRPDQINPTPLARPPADIAPEWAEGFFTVPRLPGMEDG